MSKIHNIQMISDDELCKYYYILYGLNFMKEILEQEPERCFVSDATKIYHFGIADEVLKEKLLTKYGYYLNNSEEYLWQVLSDIQKSPNNLLLCNNYAYSLAERSENLTLAHKLIQIAIEKSPTNSSYLDTYGWVKFKMGDYDIALQYAFDALKYSDNKNAEIYEHIGDIYKAKGDIETAVYYWNESIKLNPPNTADINKKITNAKK